MKKLIALLLLSAMVLGVAACAPAQSENPDTPGAPSAPTEPEKEELNVYMPPEGKEIRSILLIGNSNCSYFTDELVEISKAAGIDMVVANLYISGCSVQKHTEQLEYGLPYTKYTVRENGQVTVYDDEKSLQDAINERQWDAISLQQHYDPINCANIDIAKKVTNKYAKTIYDYLKQKQPNAVLLWHNNWAFQIGYPGDPDVHEDKQIRTPEKQQANHDIMHLNALQVCHENQACRVPTGDAWQLARADERIGHTLSNKNTQGTTDYIHDGEVGGGQYLNACVFFEVLTRKSCIGNTFRPSYELSGEKVEILQQHAHAAVAAAYGEDYAK